MPLIPTQSPTFSPSILQSNTTKHFTPSVIPIQRHPMVTRSQICNLQLMIFLVLATLIFLKNCFHLSPIAMVMQRKFLSGKSYEKEMWSSIGQWNLGISSLSKLRVTHWLQYCVLIRHKISFVMNKHFIVPSFTHWHALEYCKTSSQISQGYLKPWCIVGLLSNELLAWLDFHIKIEQVNHMTHIV